MRKVLLSLLISTLIITFYIPSCFADNPIVQTIYTADPAPMVYNGYATCIPPMMRMFLLITSLP